MASGGASLCEHRDYCRRELRRSLWLVAKTAATCALFRRLTA